MKKIIVFTILLTTTLTLIACGAQTTTAPADTVIQTPAANGTLVAPRQTPLSLQEQLIVGSFKLEDTGNAITPEQAAELLPLWQTMKAISASDTAATAEKDALIKQIQETMTAEQMQLITAMNLTRTDLFTFMQENGVESGFSGRSGQGNGTPRPDGAQRPEGFIPGQGGGQGGGGFQNLSPEQQSTMQARMTQRAENGGASTQRIAPAFYDAVIKLLQSKNL